MRGLTASSDFLAVRRDLEGIKRQRPFPRLIRAKQHSGVLQSLSKRLDRADASFAVSPLALTPLLSQHLF